ncbi:hypothetical protein CEXT_396151 [Caerostris extrusa]|uniref:Uncharacterized protein n=1 Tax=Caerostris extrusa TaxID=172846 RepID=A0AAV4MTT2_CAEEX|nr:hypothetical protein CEXT_396151 [Caerostris extrusa]
MDVIKAFYEWWFLNSDIFPGVKLLHFNWRITAWKDSSSATRSLLPWPSPGPSTPETWRTTTTQTTTTKGAYPRNRASPSPNTYDQREDAS